MAVPVYYERVKDTSSSFSSASFTLSGSAPSGSQTFQAVGGGNSCYYVAYDASGNWETQFQSYSSAGPSLTRGTPMESNNGGAQASLSGTITAELVASAAAFSQFQYSALTGPNAQTANYTLGLSDLGGVVSLPSSSTAGITVTVSSSVPWLTVIGPLSIVPSLYIVNQSTSYTISVQGSTSFAFTLNRRDGVVGSGTRTVGIVSEAQLKFYSTAAGDISGSALS